MFRTLRAIMLMCRLCQHEATDSILLLGGELDADRTENVLKIALAAESMLASERDAERLRCHPKLLANLLREGSWESDEVKTQLWAGLLKSSCSTEEPSAANQVFIDLLLHVAPAQAKILDFACRQFLNLAQHHGNLLNSSIVLSPEKVTELTGCYDAYRNAASAAYLFNLGLIQEFPELSSYRPITRFNVTPTELGLGLYKCCHGLRGKVERQLALSAHNHLRDIFPRAIVHTAPSDKKAGALVGVAGS